MKTLTGVRGFVSLASFGMSSAAQHAPHDGHAPHWDYSGDKGPDTGRPLSRSSVLVAGKNQSPIDIDNSSQVDLAPITSTTAPAAMNRQQRPRDPCELCRRR